MGAVFSRDESFNARLIGFIMRAVKSACLMLINYSSAVRLNEQTHCYIAAPRFRPFFLRSRGGLLLKN